ncbi:DUF305 domain-containing protein [Mycolicibacterium sediminis]|uniref:DUF305 domain-containing protein n=1 Tax=Mycolicibacterium sediminis TaxID=1286180 RepID=A0A7I7QKD7_9MYCO|nr:DUF305 domain-containing protein [Mycolicibacterium sediminis]BBY26732.1 DUF305 domain-containing protein [Mycolicibacterium sediminis]
MTRGHRWLVFGAVLLLALGVGAGLLIGRDDRTADAAAGPVDVGFSQDMSVHHAQAVDMAITEITGGADPAVRNLAFDILTSQQNQIGRMQGWLTAWGEPLLPTGGYMGWMSHDGHEGMAGMGAATTMPGMADGADLAALRQATGAARDVLFLQLMLRHHEGGTDMLVAGAEHAETGYVRDLARQMLATQKSEGELMTRMLRERNASPLPLR